MFTSYAQNFEDVMLWRALGHVEGGMYIDIGAQHPTTDSVSRAFYERGWRGVHVEPEARSAALLRECRPDETVIEAAVGDRTGSVAFFGFDGTGFSTCDSKVAQWHTESGLQAQVREVPMITLASVFERCGGRQIHWLKIDVEGFEEAVLTGWHPAVERPWILVIESVRPGTREDVSAHWEASLADLGYRDTYFDGLNRFYIEQSHVDLAKAFDCGPNVFDDFALSGTASAPFCAVLERRLAADHETYRRALEAQRLELIQYAENLLAGQDWQLEIRRAVRQSDFVLVCLSDDSVNKFGYVQKEVGYVMDRAEEKPEGKIFIIETESIEQIKDLVKEATALGAVCKIIEEND